MNTLQIIKSKLKSFFFKEDTSKGSFLAYFRIGTGLFILIHLLSIILDFNKLYGKQGIIPYDIREFFTSNYIISFPKIVAYFESFGFQEKTIVIGFLSVFIFFIITLMLGTVTRFSALMTLLLYKAVYSGTFIYGIDSFIITSLFYLVLFPSGYFLSIDNLLFKNRNRQNLNVTLFKRLLQINVCIVYFYAGIAKMSGTTWWNGNAIWKSLNLWSANSIFQFDYSWLAENAYILTILGWGVLIIEVLYPIFIWIPKTRKIWLTSTLLMHIGIGLLLDLYFFASFMMFWNIVAFYITEPLPKIQLSSIFKIKNTAVPQEIKIGI